jgi:hypothetical protein
MPRASSPIPCLIPLEEQQEEIYRPLEEVPEIARAFAKIVSNDDVLQFANKYGPLDHGDYWPEDVHHWLVEAEIVRRFFRVWDLIESGDTRQLAKLIKWNGDSVQIEDGVFRAQIAGVGGWYSDWIPRWKRGDILGPAKLWLVDFFNQKMMNKASPTILLNALGDFKPYSTPVNLLAAIWILCGEVITGNRLQRPCEICGGYMDVTDSRSHKRMHDTCSLRLRMRRYRKIKKQ